MWTFLEICFVGQLSILETLRFSLPLNKNTSRKYSGSSNTSPPPQPQLLKIKSHFRVQSTWGISAFQSYLQSLPSPSVGLGDKKSRWQVKPRFQQSALLSSQGRFAVTSDREVGILHLLKYVFCQRQRNCTQFPFSVVPLLLIVVRLSWN